MRAIFCSMHVPSRDSDVKAYKGGWLKLNACLPVLVEWLCLQE